MRSMRMLWLAALSALASLCMSAPAQAQSGACCFDNGGGGGCQVTATEADCVNIGGCFAGINTDCATTECQWQNYFCLLDQCLESLTFDKFDETVGPRELLKVIVKIEGQTDHAITQTLLPQRQTCVLESETEAEVNVSLTGTFSNNVPNAPVLIPVLYVTPFFPGGADDTLFCGDPNLPPGPGSDEIIMCPVDQSGAGNTCNGAPGNCPDNCDYGGNFGFNGQDGFMTMANPLLDEFVAGAGNMTFDVDITGDSTFFSQITFASFSNPVNEAEGPVVVIYIFAPTGACCLPNNTCVDDITEDDCIAQSGVYQGDNTSCLPAGACCLPDGMCINISETCCDELNGTFIGGACSPNTGACCLPNGNCVEINETCCIQQGGTFVDGPCGNNGACCLPGGTCIEVPAACCTLQGGTFIGGACSPNTGACCLPNGNCVEINETCCIQQGGTFVGGVCGADGACCLPNGTCITTPAACCALQGGTFLGGPCSPNIGACCLPNGSCVNMNETCCVDQGGTFVGGPCGGQGACCLPNGTCTVEFEACCVLAGGSFVGTGTICGDTGACCFPDGSCSIEIQACCVLAGGNFVGAGTVCGPVGRCCLPDGSCTDGLFKACCELVGGDHDPNLTCADDPSCVPQDGGCDEKGSLVIFSKIEIRWDDAGNLLQDTFLQLTNDYPSNVTIQMYFINGDPPLAADGAERAHPGWNWIDNKFVLTADQPTYWSALTGQGGNGPSDPTFSPFTVLDPGFPPGRPDVEVPGERYLRGYIIAWAVNPTNHQEIRWNHLAGLGTLVHYRDGYAWEYRTCGIPVVANVAHGQVTGMHPGELHLDGAEYRAGADLLLMNFQATSSIAFSGPVMVSTRTDVTLHPLDADLRQETEGPVTTKAHYNVWNMNEAKKSGAFRCITCWDQTLLVNYGIPNHFTLLTLQTDHGKARIDGLASALCDRDLYGPGGPGTPPDGILDVVSQPAALVGLTARLMTVDGGTRHAADGTNLFDLGAEDAVIKYDVQQGPPENFIIPSTPEGLDLLMRQLSGELPGIYPGL